MIQVKISYYEKANAMRLSLPLNKKSEKLIGTKVEASYDPDTQVLKLFPSDKGCTITKPKDSDIVVVQMALYKERPHKKTVASKVGKHPANVNPNGTVDILTAGITGRMPTVIDPVANIKELYDRIKDLASSHDVEITQHLKIKTEI